jgi:hypothetical protein
MFPGLKMAKTSIVLWMCFCLAEPLSAWNYQGHQVVAQIAYNHLDPEVRTKCDTLIAIPPPCGFSGGTFVSDATWADQRCEAGTSPQHYIDLPISLDGSPTNAVVDNPTNVVAAIRQHISTLQDPSATVTGQATALRYLIHFVGDIQQPLHCSTGVTTNYRTGDKGGNLGPYGWLHSFWDGGGGYLTDGIPVSDKVAEIEAAYPYALSVGTIPDPMDWALEGREIARTNTYVDVYATDYTARTQGTTKQRMAIGGQRLAKLLNTIFATNTPVVISAALTNGNFRFTWTAVSGRTYRVQWKQLPGDSVWNDLTDMAASTNTVTFTESAISPQRFYRAVVVN